MCGIFGYVGPEIGVASTKAFTGQLAGLFLPRVYLGRRRGLAEKEAAEIL